MSGVVKAPDIAPPAASAPTLKAPLARGVASLLAIVPPAKEKGAVMAPPRAPMPIAAPHLP